MSDPEVTTRLAGVTAVINDPQRKQALGLPADVIAALFATHEPDELAKTMMRIFGSVDDALLTSLVALSNGLSHNLERVRRSRGMDPMKLRCMECADVKYADKRLKRDADRRNSRS